MASDRMFRENLELFGRHWERLEEITTVDWDKVFPDGVEEMSPNGYYIRVTIGNQLTGGSSRYARRSKYNPALDVGVMRGDIEVGRDEDGDPVIRRPSGDGGGASA